MFSATPSSWRFGRVWFIVTAFAPTAAFATVAHGSVVELIVSVHSAGGSSVARNMPRAM
jgi:hypothetical protein